MSDLIFFDAKDLVAPDQIERQIFRHNDMAHLRELARRVGVSEAAPSRHFRGKEELLASIAVTGFEELAEEQIGTTCCFATQDKVWVTDFGANAIVRFDPKTERFTQVRLTHADAAVRQLLGVRAVVELALTIGYYTMLGSVMGACDEC